MSLGWVPAQLAFLHNEVGSFRRPACAMRAQAGALRVNYAFNWEYSGISIVGRPFRSASVLRRWRYVRSGFTCPASEIIVAYKSELG